MNQVKSRTRHSKATGNQAEKLARTRHAVLALVRKYPGVSRQDCARRLELSAFTLSHVVADLIEERCLEETATPSASSRPATGRPGTPLAVCADRASFAGIDMEASTWRFVVVDFAGQERFQMVRPLPTRRTARHHAADLAKLFEVARTACGAEWDKVQAVGVAAPGLLDMERGIVEAYHPLPAFTQIAIRDIYRELSGRPTFLLHNVVSLAAHDLWRRQGSEDEATFHAIVRSGIAGVLSDWRRVFPGSHGLAGELGHWRVHLGQKRSSRLQDVASLQALRETLHDLEPAFWQGTPDAVARAIKGSSGPRLKRAMTALGHALAGVGALIDPDRIVVHSPLLSHDNGLWPVLHDSFFEDISPTLARRVRLDRSEAPETAAACGAALFAIQNLYPSSPDPLSVPW